MQYEHHPHIPPTYESKTQYATPLNDYKPLEKEENKFIMQVTGTFLYYAREINGTTLMVMSAIGSEQPAPTKRIMMKCK